ncbi:MAG: (d)CMP kinase [Lachnospiraceae bacterium]|nr:(d)CMP kinase [Lachnospiraceae bacterium]
MFNVAIDGPAGAGKSTIAKMVAKKLGFIYVDTGSMYRAMALACIRAGVKADDKEAVCNVCKDLDVSLQYDENGAQQVILNGENVNAYIRTEEVGNMTSAIAVYGPVREKLVELQRKLATKYDIIMDGRDIGTCVLKDAPVKIYLTASSRTRAERRYRELTEKGVECNLDDIEKDIIDRDYRDMNREISPLKQAEDAVLVDSSNMSIDEVVNTLINIIEDARK